MYIANLPPSHKTPIHAQMKVPSTDFRPTKDEYEEGLFATWRAGPSSSNQCIMNDFFLLFLIVLRGLSNHHDNLTYVKAFTYIHRKAMRCTEYGVSVVP